MSERQTQEVSAERGPGQALITTPGYPSSTSEETSSEEDPTEEDAQSKERERTFSFPGSNVKLKISKHLVYHHKSKKRRLARSRHRSDSMSEMVASQARSASGDIRRGVSMPLLSQCIVEEVPGESCYENEESMKNNKPSFDCGIEGDDYTGLEDDPSFRDSKTS